MTLAPEDKHDLRVVCRRRRISLSMLTNHVYLTYIYARNSRCRKKICKKLSALSTYKDCTSNSQLLDRKKNLRWSRISVILDQLRGAIWCNKCHGIFKLESLSSLTCCGCSNCWSAFCFVLKFLNAFNFKRRYTEC